MKIKLIADSAGDVSKEFAEKYNVEIVPLYVTFGDTTYKDGVDITNEEFYDKLENSGIHPKSSLVNQYDFKEVFAKYVDEYDHIVVVTLSSDMSGTYQSAVNAAAEFDQKDKFHIYDTRSVSICTGAVVQEVAKLIASGASIEEVCKKTPELIEKVDVYATFENLKYLKAGGRMTGMQALIGTMLKVKIVLSTRGGYVVGLEKVISTKKAMRRIKDIVKETADFSYPLYFGQATMKEEVLEIIKGYQEVMPVEKWELSELGATVGTHTGPHSFGVAFFKK